MMSLYCTPDSPPTDLFSDIFLITVCLEVFLRQEIAATVCLIHSSAHLLRDPWGAAAAGSALSSPGPFLGISGSWAQGGPLVLGEGASGLSTRDDTNKLSFTLASSLLAHAVTSRLLLNFLLEHLAN